MFTSDSVAAPPEIKALPATAGLLALGTVVAGAANYFFALLLTHGLTNEQFTVFAGAQALLTIVGVVGSAGIPWVVAGEIGACGGDLTRRARVIQFGFWASVLFGLVAGVAVGAVTAVFAPPAEAAVVGVTTLVLSLGSTGMGALQGDGRTTRMAAIFVGEVAVKLVSGTVAVFVLHAGTTGALLGLLLGSTVLLESLRGLRLGMGSPAKALGCRDLWQATRYIGRLQVGIGVLGALDVLLVAGLGSSRRQSASWQVASALGKAPLFVSGALSTAVFPTLFGEEACQRRIEALRSYAMVAAFGAVVLATVPGRIVAMVFPASYSAVSNWLPWTVALGAGVGLLNLFTTFIQAEASDTTGTRIVLSTVFGELVAGGTLGYCFGLRGVAIGVVGAVWLGVLAVACLTSVGGTVRSCLVGLLHWRGCAVGLAVVTEMVAVVRWPSIWFVSTALIGIYCIARAFPELFAAQKYTRNILGIGS